MKKKIEKIIVNLQKDIEENQRLTKENIKLKKENKELILKINELKKIYEVLLNNSKDKKKKKKNLHSCYIDQLNVDEFNNNNNYENKILEILE